MLRKLHLLALFVAIFGLVQVSAQKSLKKANKQSDLRAYELAIPNYQKLLEEQPDHKEAALGLANAYRHVNRPLEAIKWYEKAIELDGTLPTPVMLGYAHVLKSVGLYDKAQRVFLEQRDANPILAEHFALSCDYARHLLTEQEDYEISLFGANSPASDFGVSFFRDQVVFASFRTDMVIGEKRNFSHIQPSGNGLFISAAWKNATKDNMKALRSPLRQQYGIGPLCYSRDGKMLAYTKNNFTDGQTQIYPTESDLSIYTAFVDERGDFYDDRPFAYNETGYATAHPFLAFNGSAMYFASNRPGGFGGFDLYVTYFKDGDWSAPENLGDRINSQGNEITPFFDGERLYFASDYHHGLGGYDVFASTVVNGEWTFPENAGRGVNSPSDDYYFAKNPTTGHIYVTSNRLGGRGLDDIYLLTPTESIEFVSNDQPSDGAVQNGFVPRAVSLADMPVGEGTARRASAEPLVVRHISSSEETVETLTDATTEDAVVTEVEESAETLTELPKAAEATADEKTTEEHTTEANDLPTPAPTVEETMETETTVIAAPATKSFNAEVSLVGARRVAIGEIIRADNRSTVYFVQLAALSRSKADLSRFKKLVRYGNIYKVYKPNSMKIRLGYYLDRAEAVEILEIVRQAGFKDAFLTSGTLDTSEMELVASNYDSGRTRSHTSTTSKPATTKNKRTSQYKLRLASYADPLWFDTSKIEDMGKIEQWTKGSWTIFVLSGFASLDDARAAKTEAIRRGFVDAELVVDKGGILEAMREQ